MIVREGMSVKYSHDEEALIAWLNGLRELPEVDVSWLDPLRPYRYSADYITDPTGYSFDRADNAWWYGRQLASGEVIRVTLWKPLETALELVATRGFSCLVCGIHTNYAERGTVYEPIVCGRLRDKQTVWGALLICRECAIDFPAMLSPWMTPRRLKGAISRLTERVAYGRLQVAP